MSSTSTLSVSERLTEHRLMLPHGRHTLSGAMTQAVGSPRFLNAPDGWGFSPRDHRQAPLKTALSARCLSQNGTTEQPAIARRAFYCRRASDWCPKSDKCRISDSHPQLMDLLMDLALRATKNPNTCPGFEIDFG